MLEKKEKHFEHFLRALSEAGRRMIDRHYFRIPVAVKEGKKEIFRERVYCYELYHQLRNILGEEFPYKLYGEVDKTGHEFIPGAKKPDFVVHDPGDMRKNLVVVEVKPIKVRKHTAELKKDLETLQIFLGVEGDYYRAIMLVYSDGVQNFPTNVRKQVVGSSKSCENRILLVWHNGCGMIPQILYPAHVSN